MDNSNTEKLSDPVLIYETMLFNSIILDNPNTKNLPDPVLIYETVLTISSKSGWNICFTLLLNHSRSQK